MNRTFDRIVRTMHRRLGRYLECQRPEGGPGAEPICPRPGRAEDLAALLAGLGHPDPLELLFMLEAFLKADNHFTAAAFGRLLKERGREIDDEKAADVLELFTSLGFAEKNFTWDGRVLYEPAHPGSHHDHIICSGCGRTTEFERPDVDGLIEKIAGDENYSHLQHKLVIYGLCPDCRRRRHEGLPLAETEVGEVVTVLGFEGSEELKRRLGDLGLRRGSQLKVLGEQSGSMIVLFDCCRLALGPELTGGVLVRAADQIDNH